QTPSPFPYSVDGAGLLFEADHVGCQGTEILSLDFVSVSGHFCIGLMRLRVLDLSFKPGQRVGGVSSRLGQVRSALASLAVNHVTVGALVRLVHFLPLGDQGRTAASAL